MLQAMLEDRFKLALHREVKNFAVYELTIAKHGSKLKENWDTTLQQSFPGDPRLPLDRNGFPQLPPGKSGMLGAPPVNGLAHMAARGVPVSALILLLSAQLGTITGSSTFASARIVDKTGLAGRYDFKLEYAGDFAIGSGLLLPVGADIQDPLGPSFADALDSRLGLKLLKSTAPYDVLVIDHAEKMPTAN